MAIYVNGITVAQSGTAVGGIEQVAVLPAVGATDHLYFLNVPDATHAVGLYYFDGTVWHSTGSGGGSGTNDYNDLDNKPRIGGIELEDNKSLAQLNIAPANTTYSTTQVDQLISASQKVYLQSTAPTALSNVGLYYVGSPTDTNYAIWLVDSTKQVTNLGNAGISLAGYQRETDGRLTWVATNGVVDAINDLNYRLNNLPSGGTITMNGTVTGSPTFYAPTTSGSFGQKLISYGPNQAPQWVTDSGDAGTKVKLNGSATVAAELSFYAPPFSGTAGQILKSQGPNLAPIWETPGSEAGPAMTLNGSVTDVTATNVKIYAPITSGDNGYILKSKGPGLAPQWEAPGSGDGTYMTLNGTETSVTIDKVNIYAPNDAGEEKQVLVSNGVDKAPTWQAFSGIPTGMIMPFAGVITPIGWLKCDGSAVSRTEYADLFNTIGTIYGDGDKVTTFNLPNLTSRFIEGGASSNGRYNAAGLPDHNHTFTGSSVTSSKTTPSMTFAGTKTPASDNSFVIDKAGWVGNNGEQGYGKGVFTRSRNKSYNGNNAGTSSGYATQISFEYTPKGTISGGEHDHTVTAAGTIDNASNHNSVYGKSSTVQPASLVMVYLIKY